MKILLIMASPGPDVGGMEKQVANQANALAGYPDVELAVVCSASYAALYSDPCQHIPLDMSPSRRNPALLHKLLRLIKEFRPDIIHAHGHKAASLINTLRLFLSDTIKVATSHGTKKNNRALQIMQQVFAVSTGVQDAIFPIPSSVIPNGTLRYDGVITNKQDLCAALNLSTLKPLVIAAGRLAPVKRYAILMAAFNGLAANLVIFGDGPQKAELTKLEGDNIKLGGFRADIRGVMAGADLLVISSEREGHSLTMIEALQAGLPVISTAVSGTRGLLPEEAIIHADNPVILHQELRTTIEKLTVIKNRQTPIFDYARQHFTIEHVAEMLHTQYHALMQQISTD